MADSSEFQVVKRKGKSTKFVRKQAKINDQAQVTVDEDGSFDISIFQKRLKEYIQELRLTELLTDCTEYLTSVIQERWQHNRGLDKDDSGDRTELNPCLLSYGIGRFISCPIARYQLALLLVLREKLKSPSCHVYDPVFSSSDKEVLEEHGCTVITHNEEGKRVCDSPTVLFMPHCGKALYNNVIWANLATLGNLVIIGNSFSRMLDSTPHRLLKKTAQYVIKVSSYVEEKPLKVSSFTHSDVFNDLAIHTFSMSRLKDAPNEFWQDNPEPVYAAEDAEIIQKEDCGKAEL